MIMEVIRYDVEGKEAAFEEAFRKAQKYLAESPHCLAYQMIRCQKYPNRFLLLIRWDSEEGHVQGFRKSPDYANFMLLVGPYMNNIEEMKHYELTGIEMEKEY